MSAKPVIGITAESEADGQPYADAIKRLDGTARLILPDNAAPVEALASVGGLIVTVGPDVGGSMEHEEESRKSPEALLLKAAMGKDMPMLAVGDGLHSLNVALGGTPARDVSGHGPTQQDGEEASSYHRIYITPGGKLAAIVGSGGFVRVNSLHRRGIREAQKSRLLLASAYSLEDGLIEGLESPDHDWVIGVQFEPQRRMEIPPHFDRLFQGIVERAGRR